MNHYNKNNNNHAYCSDNNNSSSRKQNIDYDTDTTSTFSTLNSNNSKSSSFNFGSYFSSWMINSVDNTTTQEEEETTTITNTTKKQRYYKDTSIPPSPAPPHHHYNNNVVHKEDAVVFPDEVFPNTTTTTTADDVMIGNNYTTTNNNNNYNVVEEEEEENEEYKEQSPQVDVDVDAGDVDEIIIIPTVPFSTDPKYVETLLSSRLEKISLEERYTAMHDLHGVLSKKEESESPYFLNQKIQQLNYTLLNLVAEMNIDDTKAYRLAVSMDVDNDNGSSYVDSLKPMFLRTAQYKPNEAGEKLIKHFHLKLELFGPKYLIKDVTLDDLSSEEYDVIYQGNIQLLPYPDHAGRAVVISYGSMMGYNNNNNEFVDDDITVLKAFFVFSMLLLKENIHQCQFRGMVKIMCLYNGNNNGRQKNELIKDRLPMLCKLGRALPYRLVGRHFCSQPSVHSYYGAGIYSIMDWLIRNLNGSKLVHARFHFGTPTECYETLENGYGIPKEAFPPIINVNEEDGGQGSSLLDLTNHHNILQTLKYIQRSNQSKQEEQQQDDDDDDDVSPAPPAATVVVVQPHNNTTPQNNNNNNNNNEDDDVGGGGGGIILVPNEMDVLMGKGHQPKKRPGLMKMHELLLVYCEQYDNSIKENKPNVCKLLLQDMKQHGCRFLTTTTTAPANNNNNNEGGYIECTESQAISKIMAGFRNLRQKQQRERLKQMKKEEEEQKKQTEERQQEEASTGGSTASTTSKKKRNLEEAQ